MDRSEIADKILRAKCLSSIADLATVDATVDLEEDSTGAVKQRLVTTSETESAFLDLTAYVALLRAAALIAHTLCHVTCRKLRNRDDATGKVRRMLNDVKLAESTVVPLIVNNTQHE